MAFIYLLTVTAVLILLLRKMKPNYRLPPGPPGLPLIGNVLQIGRKQPYLQLTKWAERYGKAYTIHLGHIPVLVINESGVMRDLFGRAAATGRFQSPLLTMTTWSGSYGLLTTEGKAYVEQRQFCLRVLKQFGLGKLSWMESIILDDVRDLCIWIERENKANGKVVLKERLSLATSNGLWTMLTGERTAFSDSKFAILSGRWSKLMTIGYQSGLAFFLFLKYAAPVRSGYEGLKKWCDEVQEVIPNLFMQHKISRKEGEPPRDIIDGYIDKVDGCLDKESTFFGEEGWKHSFSSIVILMIAGGNTMGNVMNWMIYYMSVHPEFQEKVHQEIGEVVGKDRDPCLADKIRLRYTEAMILETLRYASHTALSGFIRLLEDVKYEDYVLPKGMILITNVHGAHNDKTVWGDPENFRPCRFLGEGGERLKEHVVEFQPGKRACPGEFFAKDALFLFAVKLFQKFKFKAHPDIPEEYYKEPNPGFIRHSKILPVVAESRL